METDPMREISNFATDALRRIGEIGRATAAGVATGGMLIALVGCDADVVAVDPTDPNTKCETFEAGIAKASENAVYTVSIESSSQAPPDKGLNDLVLKVVDGAGAAVDSGVVLTVEPWMPAHGHGSTNITATPRGSDGLYDAPGVNLIMPGAWELRMLLTPDTGAAKAAAAPRDPGPDTKAVFTFCVEG